MREGASRTIRGAPSRAKPATAQSDNRFGLARKPLENLGNFLDVNRLCHVGVHAAIQATLTVLDKASALIAMIGMLRASGRSNPRMASVAS